MLLGKKGVWNKARDEQAVKTALGEGDHLGWKGSTGVPDSNRNPHIDSEASRKRVTHPRASRHLSQTSTAGRMCDCT